MTAPSKPSRSPFARSRRTGSRIARSGKVPSETTGSKVARFPDDLAFSLADDARDAFDFTYRRAFGNDFRLLRTDALGLAPSDRLRWQRQGIDVVLLFPDGRCLTADEKLRRSDWSDFLLEEFSDFHRLTPGWLAPDKQMDLIAYARPLGFHDARPFTQRRAQPGAQPFSQPESKDGTGTDVLNNDDDGFPDGARRWRVTLLWARPLRAKAAREWRRWVKDYGRKLADNPSYATSSLPLPWHEVHDCLVRPDPLVSEQRPPRGNRDQGQGVLLSNARSPDR